MKNALPAGAIAGGNSGYADDAPARVGVSADGRYVAFASDADALSPDAHPDVTSIYRKDRVTGEPAARPIRRSATTAAGRRSSPPRPT